MPFTNQGQRIISKHPSKIQLELLTGVGSVFVPVKALSWEKATELIAEFHSGSEQASNLTDGHIAYKGSFELGTWLTQGDALAAETDAARWEWLAYTHLVRPADEGRSREFNIHIHQAEYVQDMGIQQSAVAGGELWMAFRRCKLNRMAYTQGENGTVKRSYDWLAMRLVYGTGDEEKGGQG